MTTKSVQLAFPEMISTQEASPRKNGSAFSDPAFAKNKTQPIHRWVPWIAGFSGEFVREALQKYLPAKGVVLDPFCGVGTTLVEAAMLGHNAIGFEINPYAAIASRIKANARHYDPAQLHDLSIKLLSFFEEASHSAYQPRSKPPEGFRTRADFYSPKVLHQVLLVQDFISNITDKDGKELLQLAFASTMVKYSNYSYEPSLGRRVSAGRPDIMDYPVAQEISAKLQDMEEDIRWVLTNGPQGPRSHEARVIIESFFEYESFLEQDSIDIVITSPPYLNNYHYNRNTRPQLYWLGFANNPGDLKQLENANFGKYWQTVRDGDTVELKFELPLSDLAERISRLRGIRPDKGVYGGNGWANYAASYFNDCYTFANGLKYSLKPGSRALVVLGNSILQGILVSTEAYFAEIAQSVGLDLVDIHIPRQTRIGNSIIQSDVRVEKADVAHQLHEAVVELVKPM